MRVVRSVKMLAAVVVAVPAVALLAAPFPRASATGIGALPSGRVHIEGGAPQPADVFAGLFGGVDESVVFEIRTANEGFGNVVHVTKPSGGWATGTYPQKAFLTGDLGQCQVDSTVLEITAVTVDAGQVTQLDGAFQIDCHQLPPISGSFAFPATDPLPALDLAAAPLGTYVHARSGPFVAHNVGTTPITIGTAAIDPVTTGLAITADTCSGQSIAAGASCTVTVEFDPALAPGGAQATLDLPNDAAAVDGVSTAPISAGIDPRGFGEVHPLTPARVMDTRTGLGRPGNAVGALTAGSPASVHLNGRGGVPAGAVAGAFLVVTARDAKKAGTLTVTAGGAGASTAQSLSFGTKKAASATVLTRVSDAGDISLTSTINVNVSVDVVAWVSDDRVDPGGLRLRDLGRGYGQGLDPEKTVTLGTSPIGIEIGVRYPDNHHWSLAEVRISNASSDAELRLWNPEDDEPTVGNIAVEARVTKTALVMIHTDRYADLLLHLTKGRATVAVTPIASFEPDSLGWNGRIVFFDSPVTAFDTSLTTPIPKGVERSVSLTAPLDDAGWALLGTLTTSASKASGGVSMTGSGAPILPNVVTKPSRAMGNLALGLIDNDTVKVMNSTTNTTNARYDAVAYVAFGAPSTVTSSSVVSAAEASEADEAGDGQASAPAAETVGPLTASNAQLTFTTSDHTGWGNGSNDSSPVPYATTVPATLTGDGTDMLTFSATGWQSFRIYTGSDHKIQPGHYSSSLGTTDGTPGACDAFPVKGRVDIDVAEYSGDTLTALRGRAEVACDFRGRAYVTFAFPADPVGPILQIASEKLDLQTSPYFTGVQAPVVIQNVGNADLTIGQLVFFDSLERGNDTMAIVADACSNTSVAAGGQCTVTIGYLPDEISHDVPPDGFTLLIPTNQNVSGVSFRYTVFGTGNLRDGGLTHFVDRTTVFDSQTGTGRAGAIVSPLVASTPETVDVAAALGVDPADLWGAFVTLTATGTTGTGALTMTADGVTPSGGTTLSFKAGEKITHSALVPLSEAGKVSLRATAAVHLKVEVLAYVASDHGTWSGVTFSTSNPDKIVNTKTGYNIPKRKLRAGVVTPSEWGNDPGLYAVTVPAPSAATELKVWHADQTEADATTIYVPRGVTRTSTVALIGTGSLVFKSTVAVNVMVDRVGSFGGTPPQGPYNDPWPGRILLAGRPVRSVDTRLYGTSGAIPSKGLQGWELSFLEEGGLVLDGVIGTITTTQTTSAGSLTLFSIDEHYLPTGLSTSSRTRADASNMVVIKTGTRAAFWVYSLSGKTHYTIDWVAVVIQHVTTPGPFLDTVSPPETISVSGPAR